MKVLFLFLVSVVALGQNQKTSWQKDNLRGKVKSVESVSFQYVNKEGNMVKGEPLSNFNTLEEYNTKGFKISGKRFSREGKDVSRWKYFYDKDNYLLKVEVYNSENQLEELLKYTYDTQHRKEEVTGYDAKGNLTGKQVAHYNVNGDKINELSFNEKDSFLLNLDVVYDDKQNVSEKKFEDKDGKRVLLKYVYDDKNNIAEENYYGDANQLYGQKRFSYKYDSQGNWIERVEHIYEVQRVVTERKIEYF